MRQRSLKLAIPLVFLATLLANRLGWFDGQTAGSVLFALEIAIIAFVAIRIVVAIRRVLPRSTEDSTLWTITRDVSLDVMPKPVAMVFLGELAMWASFVQLFRRGVRLRPGEFSYHRRSSILAWALLVVVTAPAEILLIEVLLPWRTARLLLLLLAIYSVVWFLGYVVSHVVYPHAVDERSMQFRRGALARIQLVPSDIATVALDTSKLPFEKDGWGVTVIEDTGYLAVEGRADVRITLTEAKPVWGPSGNTAPVRVLRIAADEPAALVEAIEHRQSASSEPSSRAT